MAAVYAYLISKGKKTYAEVPDKIKEEVAAELEALGCSDLIVD